MNKTALITGITGQDGSYLTELLLSKGYTVHGIKRRSSLLNTERIDHLYQDPHEPQPKLILHYGDLSDPMGLTRIIADVRPDEIYNLGAMSHVKVSFETPEYTGNVNGLGTLRILEAVRFLGLSDRTKIYQASTSELFGNSGEGPLSEASAFKPRSPYAVAKLYAFWIARNYREAYGMFACNGILFNHASPRCGETFLPRKASLAAARIAYGLQDRLYIGNLDAERDWGHAKDHVSALWLMLQQEVPHDLVIATGVKHSVRQLLETVFAEVGITIDWRGKGLDEKGSDSLTGKVLVEVDPRYFRPAEVDSLLGDPSKAKALLGWEPTYTFKELIAEMVRSDLGLMKDGLSSPS